MVEIWEAKRDKEHAKELPILIPLVIYHGQQNWKIPSSLGELLNGYDELPEGVKMYIPNFEHILYDISQYSDEDLKGAAQTRIMLTLLRDILTKDEKQLRESILRSFYYLNDLEDQQTTVGYLKTMMLYIFSVAKDLTPTDVDRMIQQLETSNIDGGELAMTLAEMWRQEGLEQGMEIGEAKALSNMAIIQLTSKLGTLPKDVKESILKSDSPTLQVILTNIFSIQHVDEVRRYLH